MGFISPGRLVEESNTIGSKLNDAEMQKACTSDEDDWEKIKRRQP